MKRTASPLVRHVLWTLLLSGSVLAQDVVTLERRAQSVGTLIESSSAARQIDTSGVAAARERRDNARRWSGIQWSRDRRSRQSHPLSAWRPACRTA